MEIWHFHRNQLVKLPEHLFRWGNSKELSSTTAIIDLIRSFWALNLLKSCWHRSVWLTCDWPIIMPNCLPFVDEQLLVKCKGSAAGFSFPPHSLPPFLFLLSPHAFARLTLGSCFLPLRGNGKDCYAGYENFNFEGQRLQHQGFLNEVPSLLTCGNHHTSFRDKLNCASYN